MAAAVLTTDAGTWIAELLQRPTGPLIILVATGLFALSLMARRRA